MSGFGSLAWDLLDKTASKRVDRIKPVMVTALVQPVFVVAAGVPHVRGAVALKRIDKDHTTVTWARRGTLEPCGRKAL